MVWPKIFLHLKNILKISIGLFFGLKEASLKFQACNYNFTVILFLFFKKKKANGNFLDDK